MAQKKLIENEPRSLAYDMQKYFRKLSDRLSILEQAIAPSIPTARETLNVTLPFKNINTFEDFDEGLKNDAEKQKSFVSI